MTNPQKKNIVKKTPKMFAKFNYFVGSLSWMIIMRGGRRGYANGKTNIMLCKVMVRACQPAKHTTFDRRIAD